MREQLKEIFRVIESYKLKKLLLVFFTNKEDLLGWMDKDIIKTVNDSLNVSTMKVYSIPWIIREYTKAVVNNTNILYERIRSKDKSLMEDSKNKNDKFIGLVQSIFNDESIELTDELVHSENEIFYMRTEGDYEVYYIKGVPLFRDSLVPETITRDYYHGTILRNAKVIIKSNIINEFTEGFTSRSYYNTNKIFFSEDIENSKYYITNASAGCNQDCVIFKLDLSQFDVYRREHLLIERTTPIIYYVKNTSVSHKHIKEINYIIPDYDDYIQVDEELLLLLEESKKTWQE